jgi:hypothetical protein
MSDGLERAVFWAARAAAPKPLIPAIIVPTPAVPAMEKKSLRFMLSVIKVIVLSGPSIEPMDGVGKLTVPVLHSVVAGASPVLP